MTLARRKSSPITVDGVTYRWKVAFRSQAETDKVTLVVQPPDHGQRLTVEIPCRDPYLHLEPDSEPEPEFNYRSVTPSLVRKCMDSAIELGWSPDSKGPELAFTLQPGESLKPLNAK